MTLVDLQKEGGIATVTVNRPDKLNALNGALIFELIEAFEGLAGDLSRVVQNSDRVSDSQFIEFTKTGSEKRCAAQVRTTEVCARKVHSFQIRVLKISVP